MNQEIKAKWVATLRSGEYKQVRGLLRYPRHNTFCCLGVLCDLYTKATGLPWESAIDRYDELPPPPVVAWAELPAHSPEVNYMDVPGGYSEDDEPKTSRRTLAELNDHGLSFADIADLIEEQL